MSGGISFGIQHPLDVWEDEGASGFARFLKGCLVTRRSVENTYRENMVMEEEAGT